VKHFPALHHAKPNHTAIKLPKIARMPKKRITFPLPTVSFHPTNQPAPSHGRTHDALLGTGFVMQPCTGGTARPYLPVGNGRGGRSFADKRMSREERQSRQPLQVGKERKYLRARGTFGWK